MKLSVCVLALVFALAPAAPAAGADAPVPVSPGAPDRFVGVGSPCPTFSWSAVESATGYDLVVYRATLPEEAFSGSADPVLRARIPAGALAWTPAAEECLELAGSYAWLIRATGGATAAWSASRLFRVDVDAVLREIGPVLKRAIERELRREQPVDELVATSLPGRAAEGGAEPAPGSSGIAAAIPLSPQAAAALGPEPRGVLGSDVELWLEETEDGLADRVQIVLATPEFDGDPINGDAWSISVSAWESGGIDDGTLVFSTPSFADALRLFADGTATLGRQRVLSLRKYANSPLPCTAGQEGSFYWDDTANVLCVCDGLGWKPVDADEVGTCS